MNVPHGRNLKAMSNEKLAWLAGFMDGEGWVGMYKSKGTVRPAIQITSTYIDVISRIANTTGVGTVNKVLVTGNRKPRRSWNVHSTVEISQLLPQLMSYLFVKKAQAKLLAKYCAEFLINPRRNFDVYYNSLKKLNKRGAR